MNNKRKKKKELSNKDNTTCGKERVIADCCADPQVQGAVA
jgi:hypothetical protein